MLLLNSKLRKVSKYEVLWSSASMSGNLHKHSQWSVIMIWFCNYIIVILLSVDECFNSPCQNNAPCKLTNTSYECTCLDGFLGIDCEIGKAMSKKNWLLVSLWLWLLKLILP